MEGKVTTYLFYMGILFSLAAMIASIFVFQKNAEEHTLETLRISCEEMIEKEEIESLEILEKDSKKITKADFSDIEKKGYASGIIKTEAQKSNTGYVIIPYKEKYLIGYSEIQTLSETINRAFPFLIVIFIFIIILSAAFAVFLSDRFMKPVRKISDSEFVFTDNPEVYEELIPILNVKSKAEKMKRQFTANVSHELKTPLTSILGYAQLIESEIATGEDVVKFASVINKESQRMLYLVGDILKLSELEEENSNIAKENIDLFEISKNAIDSLEVVAQKNGISMTLLGENTVISGNKNLIYELIYNLCDNAIRYNKQGGSVMVETKNNSVTVSDTGIGIDKKYHSRIFERFYRVDKSRSKQTGGTGLGLSIVKHIAELHGGKITITSEPEAGTQIKVSFS